ncbi:MAG TPA: hypothetical protein DCW90_22165 [Lachnospiraceae bacterium]|nr:hypothetical protein [Lachnospiraceae bacterium]
MWIKTTINTQNDINELKLRNLSDKIFSFCDARYKLTTQKLFYPVTSDQPKDHTRIQIVSMSVDLFQLINEIDALNQFYYGKDLEDLIRKIMGQYCKLYDQFIHGIDALYFSFTGGALTNDELFKSFRKETLEIVQKKVNPAWFPKISQFIRDETVAHHLIESNIGLKNVTTFEKFIYHDALMLMIMRIDPELIFEL